MKSLRDWNSGQVNLFRRYCRLYRLAFTPEILARLGDRYARKHATNRPARRPELRIG